MTDPRERAAHLKALADRPGTPAEAEAAAKALAKHLARHRLELAELDERGETGIDESPITSGARIAIWRTNLIIGLGRLYGAVPFVRRVPRRPCRGQRRRVYTRSMLLCGLPADVARVRRLYRQLADDVERLGREHPGDRRAFRVGFVEGLLASARAGVQSAAAECDSTALVRIDERYSRASSALAALTGLGAPGAKRIELDKSSYGAGYAAGKQRHVGEQFAEESSRP